MSESTRTPVDMPYSVRCIACHSMAWVEAESTVAACGEFERDFHHRLTCPITGHYNVTLLSEALTPERVKELIPGGSQ